MPKIIAGRPFLDRKNNIRWPRANSTGWFDGLAFIVSSKKDGHPEYTVDEEGFAYPTSHPMFQDDQGYYQLDFFNVGPRLKTQYDLVEEV